jgi:hypothetical protein
LAAFFLAFAFAFFLALAMVFLQLRVSPRVSIYTRLQKTSKGVYARELARTTHAVASDMMKRQ